MEYVRVFIEVAKTTNLNQNSIRFFNLKKSGNIIFIKLFQYQILIHAMSNLCNEKHSKFKQL